MVILKGNVSGKKDKETTKEEEFRKLETRYRNIVSDIKNSALTPKQQREAIREAGRVLDYGQKPVYSNIVEKGIGDAIDFGLDYLGDTFSPVGKTYSAARKYVIDPTVRSANSAATEINDAVGVVATALNLPGAKDFDYEGRKVSFSDYVRQAETPRYNVYGSNSPYEKTGKYSGPIARFAAEVAADPTTYLTLGAGTASRASRIALATTYGTKEMKLLYPQLVGLESKIMRHGVAAIPKEVRAAEGIVSGMKFMGVPIKNSDIMADVWMHTGGAARGFVGDFVPTSILSFTAPKSIKNIVNVGGGRSYTLDAVTSELLTKDLAELAFNNAYRGSRNIAGRKALAAAYEFLDAWHLGNRDFPGQQMGEVYRAIENPSIIPTLPIEAQNVANSFRAWDDGLRNTANATITEYGVKYGLDVSEIGFIDSHLYHQITPKARRYARNPKTLGEGATTSRKHFVEFNAETLVENAGTSTFRRLKAPWYNKDGVLEYASFLGEDVTDASIDGINKISQRVLGFDWFETNLAVIAQGTADSYAKSIGRVAGLARAMEFGPDIVKPLISRMVPDKALASILTKANSALIRSQGRYVKSLVKKYGQVRTVAAASNALKVAINLSEQILDGTAANRTTVTAEHMATVAELDNVIAGLKDVLVLQSTLSATAKGDWATVWQVQLAEVEKFRAALLRGDGERYIAEQNLRDGFMRLFPDSAPDELDGKSAEWMAERIRRATGGGRSVAREEKNLIKMRSDLQSELDSLAPDDVAARDMIEGQLIDITSQLEGAQKLAKIRVNASYSDDGLMYGSMPSGDGDAPFQMFTTKPMDTKGYMDSADSVVGHAIPENELVDLRVPENMLGLVDVTKVASDLNDAWMKIGVGDPAIVAVADNLKVTGKVDELYASLHPEKAELLQVMHDFSVIIQKDIAAGDVTDFTHKDVASLIGFVNETMSDIMAKFDIEGADDVANIITNEWLGSSVRVATQAGKRGVLVPMVSVLPDMENIGGQWAVLTDNAMTPDVGGHPSDAWQFLADNAFVARVHSGSMESLAPNLLAAQDEVAARLAKVASSGPAKAKLAAKLDAVKAREDLVVQRKALSDSGVVEVDGRKVRIDKVVKSLSKMDEFVQKSYDDIDADIMRVNDAEMDVDGLLERRMTATERLPSLLDQLGVLDTWDDTVGKALQLEVTDAINLLRREPAKGSTAASNAAWVRSVEADLKLSSLIDDPVVRAAYDKLISIFHADTVAFNKATSVIAKNNLEITAAMVRMIPDMAEEGWEAIEKMGVQMPKDMVERWRGNLGKMRDPGVARNFVEAWNAVQQYWKKNVTSTVGFFVRNGMSSTFMNFADGVAPKYIIEGLRWSTAMGQRTKGGYGNWMQRLGITEVADKEFANKVWEVVEATGRGISDDYAVPTFGKRGVRGMYNGYHNFFGNKNEWVERSVRIPMAIDSLRNGQSVDQAIARISRVHINYADTSELDDIVKKVIPFWVWTSRNLPLQVSQIATRPKAYYEYERLKERAPLNSNVMMPKWILDRSPIGIAGTTAVFTPDLPHLRIMDTIKSLVDPKRLLGMANPIIKIPAELASNRPLGIDIGPFGKDIDAKGLDQITGSFLKLVRSRGLISTAEDGSMMVDPKVPYLWEQLVPQIGVIHRVFGGRTGGKDTLEERQMSSIANYLGIPYRNITDRQERSESIGRSFKLDNMRKWLNKLDEENRNQQP